MTWDFSPVRPGYDVGYDFSSHVVSPSPQKDAATDDGDRDRQRVEPGVDRGPGTAADMSVPSPIAYPAVASPPDDMGLEAEANTVRGEAASNGEGGQPAAPPSPAGYAPGKIAGCAISGSLLAIATLEPGRWSWKVSQAHSRMFHLKDHTQEGLRKFVSEVHTFLSRVDAATVSACRTKSGSWTDGLEDEARIETLLMMMPGLPVGKEDNDRVADWVLSSNPASPEGMPQGRLTYVEIRAIETAQYVATGKL